MKRHAAPPLYLLALLLPTTDLEIASRYIEAKKHVSSTVSALQIETIDLEKIYKKNQTWWISTSFSRENETHSPQNPVHYFRFTVTAVERGKVHVKVDQLNGNPFAVIEIGREGTQRKVLKVEASRGGGIDLFPFYFSPSGEDALGRHTFIEWSESAPWPEHMELRFEKDAREPLAVAELLKGAP